MSTQHYGQGHALMASRRTLAGLIATFGALLLLLETAGATSPQDMIVRVEEDWELVVGEPDHNSQSPQIVALISPAGIDGWHATVELNHQSAPFYETGGVHLQLWQGDRQQKTHSRACGQLLAQTGETVRWTQAMTVHECSLIFEVASGQSESWGAFGGEPLKHVIPAPVVNLNGYDPSVSLDNSGVALAAHRVRSLVLKRVRLFAVDGSVTTIETDRRL